jgi:hypothetical protein
MLITLLVAGAVGLGASGPLDKVEKARRLGPARVTQSCTAERCAAGAAPRVTTPDAWWSRTSEGE